MRAKIDITILENNYESPKCYYWSVYSSNICCEDGLSKTREKAFVEIKKSLQKITLEDCDTPLFEVLPKGEK